MFQIPSIIILLQHLSIDFETKITLKHAYKDYSYSNDIQKMMLYVMKYANIDFDYDRDIVLPKKELKNYL